MSVKDESASGWLSKWITEAKRFYISASVLTLLSAGCFVVFSWYLSDFAATWLVMGQVFSQKLLYALAFLAGRYVFAHYASLIHYKAGNLIVSTIKRRLYPRLLNNSQSDAISSTLFVTRVSDDLKPYFSFFIPYATASVLVGVLLLIVSFWFEKLANCAFP